MSRFDILCILLGAILFLGGLAMGAMGLVLLGVLVASIVLPDRRSVPWIGRFGILALVAVIVLSAGSAAWAGDGTVTIPWGDWIADGVQTLASLCLAALSWVLARWAPQWVRMQLTEQLLSRAVDYGIAVVAGAARGKVLEIPVANEVIREAAAYAVANAPATAKWLGSTLEPKLLARLGAAGHLPENAVRVPTS